MNSTHPPPRAGKQGAATELRRMLKWIVFIAVVMVVAALAFEASQGPLYVNQVIATVLGVFISMVLGCGLFALAFFSSKSGHDDDVRGATGRQAADRRD
jgi:4-hydroxybenzoate polyprenyltransferase